jgi:hypothetical protein
MPKHCAGHLLAMGITDANEPCNLASAHLLTFITGNKNHEETAWSACGLDCGGSDLPRRHPQPD